MVFLQAHVAVFIPEAAEAAVATLHFNYFCSRINYSCVIPVDDSKANTVDVSQLGMSHRRLKKLNSTAGGRRMSTEEEGPMVSGVQRRHSVGRCRARGSGGVSAWSLTPPPDTI